MIEVKAMCIDAELFEREKIDFDFNCETMAQAYKEMDEFFEGSDLIVVFTEVREIK